MVNTYTLQAQQVLTVRNVINYYLGTCKKTFWQAISTMQPITSTIMMVVLVLMER